MKIETSRHYWPLILVFFIFSMLLNCMGIIILQFSEEKISYCGLGLLESFKDLPIALASLIFVNFINRYGNKSSLIFSLFFVAVCCIAVPFIEIFWIMKIWFALIGVGFAVAKISTFSLIKSNFNSNELAVVMNKVEASFMLGIFLVNTAFGWLISSAFKEYWKFGFWFIAFAAALNIFFLFKLKYKESVDNERLNAIQGFKKIVDRKNVIFLLIMLLIVFTEQCLNSWLPTFYKNNFRVDAGLALQSSAFLALVSFVGRSITSRLIKKFIWFRYTISCLYILVILLLLMFIFVNYLPQFNLFLVYLIPAIGLFISPLYPLFNSKMLQNYDETKVNMLISAVVIVSSLGSSLGSIYISSVFHIDRSTLYPLFILIPVLILIVLAFSFRKNIISK